MSLSPVQLRDYQTEAVDAVFDQWRSVQSTLGVAATGAGKTQIFCEIIRRSRPGRAIILAHRTELVQQAVRRLKHFGIEAEIEQGEWRASITLWNRTPVVVATPQTLYHGGFARLQRFKPSDFSLLICDEAHHYSGAPAFQRVVEHFKANPRLKLLGVTATPDRADNIALARVFESVAFNIEITDLIRAGWLVDVDQRMVKIESLDLSRCRVTAGDLNAADLARVIEHERNLLGMADALLKIAAGRRAVVFASSVLQAERFAEILNRHKAGSADCVFGHTPEDKRAEILKRFAEGALDICVNVGVLTEGYDNPGIEVIVMARPTLSRSLYAQMIGRGTRPLPGVVESVLINDAEARRRAIAESPKPHVTVLDFAGNSGRHKLVTTADILGGRLSEEARALARSRVLARGGGRMLDELEIAELELKKRAEAAARAGIVARAEFRMTYVDPFDVFSRRAQKWRGFTQTRPLSAKQHQILLRHGYNPYDLSPQDGQAIINKIFGATDRQIAVLVKCGYTPAELDGLQKWEASKLIDLCARNNWKRPPKPGAPERQPEAVA